MNGNRNYNETQPDGSKSSTNVNEIVPKTLTQKPRVRLVTVNENNIRLFKV